jgi:hypothetical protein
LRAFWSTAIVLCLLAAGARHVEPNVRGDTTHIDVAVHTAAGSLVRRSTPVDAHLRPLFVVPASPHADHTPPRSALLVDTQLAPGGHDSLFLPTRSSRGPPHC